jgi:hypothetical protein
VDGMQRMPDTNPFTRNTSPAQYHPKMVRRTAAYATNLALREFAGHRITMSTEAMATRSNAPFQKIAYLYRDAGNYKFQGEFCVAGTLTLNDLIPHLFESEYFVPKIVGIPSLVPACKNDDDHDFHEIVSITPTVQAHCAFTARELIERFRAANERDWF